MGLTIVFFVNFGHQKRLGRFLSHLQVAVCIHLREIAQSPFTEVVLTHKKLSRQGFRLVCRRLSADHVSTCVRSVVGRSSISSVCRLAVCISIENTIVQYICFSFNNYRKSLRGNNGIISVSEQSYQVLNEIEIESDFIVTTFANKWGFSRLPEVRSQFWPKSN